MITKEEPSENSANKYMTKRRVGEEKKKRKNKRGKKAIASVEREKKFCREKFSIEGLTSRREVINL